MPKTIPLTAEQCLTAALNDTETLLLQLIPTPVTACVPLPNQDELCFATFGSVSGLWVRTGATHVRLAQATTNQQVCSAAGLDDLIRVLDCVVNLPTASTWVAMYQAYAINTKLQQRAVRLGVKPLV